MRARRFKQPSERQGAILVAAFANAPRLAVHLLRGVKRFAGIAQFSVAVRADVDILTGLVGFNVGLGHFVRVHDRRVYVPQLDIVAHVVYHKLIYVAAAQYLSSLRELAFAALDKDIYLFHNGSGIAGAHLVDSELDVLFQSARVSRLPARLLADARRAEGTGHFIQIVRERNVAGSDPDFLG